MRRIKFHKGYMDIYNSDESGKLNSIQLVLVPYASRGQEIKDKFYLNYGGIVGYINIDKGGIKGHGYSIFNDKLPEEDTPSTKTLDEQIAEFLYKSRILTEKPVTLLKVDYNGLTPEEANRRASSTYKDTFIRELPQEFVDSYTAAIVFSRKRIKIWYDPNTDAGKSNINVDAHFRILYGNTEQILHKASKAINPKRARVVVHNHGS